MTFLHPEFIYLMLPPILVLFYFLLTQSEQHLQFFSDEILDRLRVQSNMMAQRARNGLFLLMFVMIILSLAQPVIEEGRVKVKAKSADIMVALDISDSMLAEDIYPNRLIHAKRKIMRLLELSGEERIGVMAFAQYAYLVSPLSFDHRAVRFLVKQTDPSSMTEKGTDFMQLIRSAAEILKENRQKYLLILSDGGDERNFDAVTYLAKEQGIKVFVLAVGTNSGAPIKNKKGGFVSHNGQTVITRLNHDIAELAIQTGGAYMESISSSEDIEAMLDEIIQKTDQKTLKEEEIIQYVPLFIYPLGIAMLLLLVATSSMSARRELNVPPLFIGIILLYPAIRAEAWLLDFQVLKSAKSSYETGEYKKSAQYYGDYAARNHSNEAYYNQANALYKEGSFKHAVEMYSKVYTPRQDLQFNVLFNLGNAYAKQGKTENYLHAVKAYEKALKIKKDKKTKENLEMVKARLKEDEQKEVSQDKNDSFKDQTKQEYKPQTSKEQEKDKHSNNTQSNQQPQGSKEQSTMQKSQSDSHGGKKKESKREHIKADEKQNQQAKLEEEKQKKQAKSDKNKRQSEKDATKRDASDIHEEFQMSDLEAKKWIKVLNEQSPSHIYRLTPTNNTLKRDENAKPW